MAFSSRTCCLRSLKNLQKIIKLPHETPVFIGRNEDSGITDVHVSRQHLECTADVNAGQVTVKTLGKCHSGCNGYALMKGESYSLKHGDRIEVRLGFHEFEIVFEPPVDYEEPAAKKPKLGAEIEFVNKGEWEEIDDKELLLYTSENCDPRPVIAAFDLDGTLTKTKSGARFPKDCNDWVLNFSNTASRLAALFKDNHKIVIFTNQAGIGRDSAKGFKGKIEAIIEKIAVPVQVFVATGKTFYRKPAPGMWQVLVNQKNGKIPVDVTKSFYVGDAAGRDKRLNKKKDHSSADRLFALNVGLTFYTPEEYFQMGGSVNEPYVMPEFDPRNLPDADYPDIGVSKLEVVMMVGGPGSGKSHYCRTQLVPNGYVHVNRDKLGTWQKCVKKLEECLQRKQSVVVDNTNPDKDSRQRYINVAKKYGVDCRCFVLTTTLKHAKHNNKFRELIDKSHITVGDLVLNSYKKNYQEPELSEGFTEIVKVPFVPKFEKAEHETLYKLFLVES